MCGDVFLQDEEEVCGEEKCGEVVECGVDGGDVLEGYVGNEGNGCSFGVEVVCW